MNHPYRHPVTIGTAILGVTAMYLIQARAAHACETTCTIPTYVAGHLNSVEGGDIIGVANGTQSEDYAIIHALGEDVSHVFHNDYAGGQWVTENIFDKAQVTSNWDCTHPISPYDLVTVRPGVLFQAPADGNMAYTTCGHTKDCHVVIQEAEETTPWGLVGAGGPNITLVNAASSGKLGAFTYLRGEAKTACSGYALYDGYESPGGYELYAFTHYPGPGHNGMCVDFLNSYCGVPRPTPRKYSQATTLAATNAMYNYVWDDCNSKEGWATSLFCSGACDRAADQFVNTFWYNSGWDTAEYNHTTGAPMVTALSSIVTPAALMEGFGSNKPVPISATNYTFTTRKGMCTIPGNCP
jgi:hypothetical protein